MGAAPPVASGAAVTVRVHSANCLRTPTRSDTASVPCKVTSVHETFAEHTTHRAQECVHTCRRPRELTIGPAGALEVVTRESLRSLVLLSAWVACLHSTRAEKYGGGGGEIALNK